MKNINTFSRQFQNKRLEFNTLRYILLASFIFVFTWRAAAQQNVKQSADYYLNFWKTNLDSLCDSWVVKQQFTPVPPKIQAEISSPVIITEQNCGGYVAVLHPKDFYRRNPRVREILTYYLQQKSRLEIAFSYRQSLDAIFIPELKKAGLPEELKNLPIALSAMNNKAIGKTGAGGLWQIMYANGRRQGLRIDSYVDERRDVRVAAKAAIAELKFYYGLYQNWELALAAYTCGATNVNKAIRRNDNQKDFYAIYQSLPDFGRDVVPAVTAISIIEQNKKTFELNIPEWKLNIPVDTVEVSQRLHFAQLEAILDIPIEELRYLNPKYKFDIVPAIDEVFHILLPAGKLAGFNALEDSIYHYKDTILFNLKKPVVLPPPSKGSHYSRYQPELPPDNSTLLYYTIKSGDNLGYIASWYGVKVRQIEDWNNIYDPRRLKLGRKLKIYVPEDKADYYRPVDKLSFAEKQKRVGRTVSAKQAQAQKQEPLGPDFFWYTVKPGESPYIIAKKYPGVSADDIMRWNNIKDPRYIKAGQKLKIKRVK